VTNFKAISHLLRREQRLLALFLAVAALVFTALKLAGEMLDGDTLSLDRMVLTALRQPGDLGTPIGPAWLPATMIDVTALGGTTNLTLVSVLAIAFMLLLGRYRHAVYMAAATGGGAIFGSMLKSHFARARPEVVPHLLEVHSLSFPSGHALNSAIVYLTLAILIAREFEQRRLRIFVVGAAALLVLLIGFTRPYLGVHFPSDVLAGWMLGASWALAMGIVADLLHRFLRRGRTADTPGSSG
jgi:undecaprenyl-diphosphatase